MQQQAAAESLGQRGRDQFSGNRGIGIHELFAPSRQHILFLMPRRRPHSNLRIRYSAQAGRAGQEAKRVCSRWSMAQTTRRSIAKMYKARVRGAPSGTRMPKRLGARLRVGHPKVVRFSTIRMLVYWAEFDRVTAARAERGHLCAVLLPCHRICAPLRARSPIVVKVCRRGKAQVGFRA